MVANILATMESGTFFVHQVDLGIFKIWGVYDLGSPQQLPCAASLPRTL